MTTTKLLGLFLLFTCGGCAERTFEPAPGYPAEAMACEAPRDVSQEIAMCEATGTSEKECDDSHFVAPPPPAQVTLSALDMLGGAAHTLWVAKHEAAHQAHTR